MNDDLLAWLRHARKLLWEERPHTQRVKISDAVDAAAATIQKLQAKNGALSDMIRGAQVTTATLAGQYEAVLCSVVATIGGTVEGHPTSSINYLQRLRELVKAEAERDAAIAELRNIAALSPERIIAMIAVIEAAKAMRNMGALDAMWSEGGRLEAFDAALERLEQE